MYTFNEKKKMNSKIIMSIVFLINIFLFAILSLKSNENTINNPLNTKIIDSNVRVFFNRVIHEYFDDNSFSAMNLLTGVVVP